jgi:ubiquinone/menaquinone biosynthesis C-methylase UbiE
MSCYVKLGGPCTLQQARTIKKRKEFILDHFKINKSWIILDVGTGFGIYIYQLSHYAKSCIGIDIAKENLYEANKRKIETENIELVQMSAENLAFKENMFDAVIMIEVFEHVLDDGKALNEIYRVLKPGGKLIITAPNKLFPFETHGFRIRSRNYSSKGLGFPFLPYLPEILRMHMVNARIYTPWHLKRMLVENGFQIKDVGFLSPSFDQLRINFPKLGRLLERLQDLLDIIEKEKVPILNIFLIFLTTIIVCAEKVRE